VIEEMLPGIYRIEVPLPQNPLRAINSYVIKGHGRNLMIDTGMNQPECRAALETGMRELGVDPRDTDFFVTHMHADHAGLVADLAADGSIIYASRLDASIINNGPDWDGMRRFAHSSGFPWDELQQAIDRHPAAQYRTSRHVDFTIVGEGDVVSVDRYRFRCVETPGHTWGHLCLYDEDQRLLVSGDHVLGDITPNISVWSSFENPLDIYLKSLDKVSTLAVDLVLPGHRRAFPGLKGRIEELKRHHEIRADEVLDILKDGAMNPLQVAARMTWDMTYRTFDEFPVQQKWFAGGEAVAHLRYLEEKGLVQQESRGNQMVYALG
jgi:glyoxylase-like metal-dependent hydrolase (beta-lactamase superfamily II)